MGAKVKINSSDVRNVTQVTAKINRVVKKILYAKTMVNGVVKKIAFELGTKIKMFGKNVDSNSTTAINYDGTWLKSVNVDKNFKVGSIIKTRSKSDRDQKGGEILLNGVNVGVKPYGTVVAEYDYVVKDKQAQFSLTNNCIFIEDGDTFSWGTIVGPPGRAYISPDHTNAELRKDGDKFPTAKRDVISVYPDPYGSVFLNGVDVGKYVYNYVATGTNVIFKVEDPNIYIIEEEIIDYPVIVTGEGGDNGYMEHNYKKNIFPMTFRARSGDTIGVFADEDPHRREEGNISYNYELIRKDSYGSSKKEITVDGPINVHLEDYTVWLTDKPFTTYNLTIEGQQNRDYWCYIGCVNKRYTKAASLKLIAGLNLELGVTRDRNYTIILNGVDVGKSYTFPMPTKDVHITLRDGQGNMVVTY